MRKLFLIFISLSIFCSVFADDFIDDFSNDSSNNSQNEAALDIHTVNGSYLRVNNSSWEDYWISYYLTDEMNIITSNSHPNIISTNDLSPYLLTATSEGQAASGSSVTWSNGESLYNIGSRLVDVIAKTNDAYYALSGWYENNNLISTNPVLRLRIGTEETIVNLSNYYDADMGTEEEIRFDQNGVPFKFSIYSQEFWGEEYYISEHYSTNFLPRVVSNLNLTAFYSLNQLAYFT